MAIKRYDIKLTGLPLSSKDRVRILQILIGVHIRKRLSISNCCFVRIHRKSRKIHQGTKGLAVKVEVLTLKHAFSKTYPLPIKLLLFRFSRKRIRLLTMTKDLTIPKS